VGRGGKGRDGGEKKKVLGGKRGEGVRKKRREKMGRKKICRTNVNLGPDSQMILR